MASPVAIAAADVSASANASATDVSASVNASAADAFSFLVSAHPGDQMEEESRIAQRKVEELKKQVESLIYREKENWLQRDLTTRAIEQEIEVEKISRQISSSACTAEDRQNGLKKLGRLWSIASQCAQIQLAGIDHVLFQDLIHPKETAAERLRKVTNEKLSQMTEEMKEEQLKDARNSINRCNTLRGREELLKEIVDDLASLKTQRPGLMLTATEAAAYQLIALRVTNILDSASCTFAILSKERPGYTIILPRITKKHRHSDTGVSTISR